MPKSQLNIRNYLESRYILNYDCFSREQLTLSSVLTFTVVASKIKTKESFSSGTTFNVSITTLQYWSNYRIVKFQSNFSQISVKFQSNISQICLKGAGGVSEVDFHFFIVLIKDSGSYQEWKNIFSSQSYHILKSWTYNKIARANFNRDYTKKQILRSMLGTCYLCFSVKQNFWVVKIFIKSSEVKILKFWKLTVQCPFF